MSQPHYSLHGFPLFDSHYQKFSIWWVKHYLNPKNYWRAIKYFCQRGWRGYADCDYWDADGYFSRVMIGVLTDLRDNSMGYPAGLCNCTKSDQVNCDDHEKCDGMKLWKGILTEIIEGLEASLELKAEETIPEEVYPNSGKSFNFVPDPDNPELEKLVYDDPVIPGFNKDAYDQWAAPLLLKQRRAGYLLRKYWGTLWD